MVINSARISTLAFGLAPPICEEIFDTGTILAGQWVSRQRPRAIHGFRHAANMDFPIDNVHDGGAAMFQAVGPAHVRR